MEQISANSNKKLNFILVGLGILILGAMIFMRKVKIQTDIDFSFLAGFHSTVNAITFFVLLYALYQIKRKKYRKASKGHFHIALSLSVLFLVSYVVYHSTTPETKFCHQGVIRYIYFFSFDYSYNTCNNHSSLSVDSFYEHIRVSMNDIEK
jgi:uncharacterized membrane protein YozB (DUF420 family)